MANRFSSSGPAPAGTSMALIFTTVTALAYDLPRVPLWHTAACPAIRPRPRPAGTSGRTGPPSSGGRRVRNVGAGGR
ncbi:hypothetical protein FAIPA1_70197 [Frankia sp. AiPs1]